MDGALTGLTVLDLATFVAAPFCATLLGDFGAEVIKVEQPGAGDDLRRLGKRATPSDAAGRATKSAEPLSGSDDRRTAAQAGRFGGGAPPPPSLWWFVEARNKKSITCNLRTPEGQALVKRLAAGADVLAENFRPGTLERWNLGWDELCALNRGLVMVRISAFGQTGPSRERPGFGRIAGAVSGISYISGYPDRPPVSPGTPTVPDYLAGVMGAFGALVALQHRARTGEGQVVDVALYEPMLRMLDEMLPLYAATGHVRERIGSGTEYVTPHNHYRTRDGRWVAIACTNDRMFGRLATAMGRPGLATDFATMTARLERREELDRIVQEWVGRADASAVLATLDASEVPSSLVASVRDLFEDPQVRARDNIADVANPLGGMLRMAGIVPKLSRTPGAIEHAGPLAVGEHNEEIYCGRLGLTRAELAGLKERGVV